MTETLWRLHDLICQHGLTVKEAINLFDEAGLISNHVVFLSNMADVDAVKCIEFLKQNHHSK